MDFKLLSTFESLFKGKRYRHRDSSLGDSVAAMLYEDLFALGKSAKIIERIKTQDRVLNRKNITVGKKARRGDGTFGELVPTADAVLGEGLAVAVGPVANIEVGVETKILAKAMIKQIDRVISDLRRQVEHFKSHGNNPICIGIAGVNFAESCTSYEGDRPFPTDGKKYKHPCQEAQDAISRLLQKAAPEFAEFLILKFAATNVEPYRFAWIDAENTRHEYAAMLTRISREYDRRF
jgi:hypothetical protein